MSQAATVLSFRHHYHPEEVSPDVRHRMAHNIAIDQLIWSGFIVLITGILAVGTAIVDSVDKVSSALYWHVGVVLAIGVCAEIICFAVFESRKRFVREMPATTAEIVRERHTGDFSAGLPRVQLRYVPKSVPFDAERMRKDGAAVTAWAELDGLSTEFEENLHEEDLVTILYDPKRPAKVRIVEFEH